jgi:hypothetical protein
VKRITDKRPLKDSFRRFRQVWWQLAGGETKKSMSCSKSDFSAYDTSTCSFFIETILVILIYFALDFRLDNKGC